VSCEWLAVFMRWSIHRSTQKCKQTACCAADRTPIKAREPMRLRALRVAHSSLLEMPLPTLYPMPMSLVAPVADSRRRRC
jgi:hypothetical protein